MQQGAKEHGAESTSDLFQFDKSGQYRIRLLTKPVAIATHFFGPGQPSVVCVGVDKGCPFHGPEAPKDDKGNEKRPSVKFMAYVVDRSDGKVKLGELPWSVIGRVADFEEDEEFQFDGYPMPYDIKIKVDKENKDPKSIYKAEASPKMEPISAEEGVELSDKISKTTPEQYVQKRKDKQLEKFKFDGTLDREIARREKIGKEMDALLPEIQVDDYPTPESEGIDGEPNF